MKMKGALVALLLGSLVAVGSAAAADSAHWSYSGEAGPEHWAQLTPEFGACKGKSQSPLDLNAFVRGALAPLKFAYKAGGDVIVNNGHTIQVNYGAGSGVVVDGHEFVLKQFHFHAPSENRIKGRSYAMEAHLVHADQAGHLAVVAIMFAEGTENKGLAELWHSIPDHEQERALSAPFDAARLLPAKRDYYRYDGSLTTPPCTEGVRWLVLKTPVSASKAQVATFSKVMHHPNNRPVQPVNGRTVLE